MVFKRRSTGRAAVKRAKKVRRKKAVAAARKRGRGPTGRRVELWPTQRKQKDGSYAREWRYKAIARNGRVDGGSEAGESFKRFGYAVKRADAQYADRPIYVMPAGRLLEKFERPSRDLAHTVTSAVPNVATGIESPREPVYVERSSLSDTPTVVDEPEGGGGFDDAKS